MLSPALAERVRSASRVVAFTGAGISAESGLGTFRGADGLWEKFRPEDLATPEAFERQPAMVWRWYAERHRSMAAARPNPGHLALASWADLFPSFTLVTQNIDHLHQRGGARDVLELHGSLFRARCSRCGTRIAFADALARPGEPPPCVCGGALRPDVVWFGEMLPDEALAAATRAARRAEIFVSVGTSATVYPAAGLIELAHDSGAAVIEVNPEPTPLSWLGALKLREPAAVALPALTDVFRTCREPF